MTCLPSIDVACRMSDRTSPFAQLEQVHVLASVIGFGGAIIGMLALASWLRQVPRWRRLGALGTANVFLVTGLGLLELALMVLPGLWVGVPERAETLLESTWYGALAFWLIADAC